MLFEMNPSVRILRGSSHLAANSVVYWATWHTSSYGVPLVAYLANSGIPVFTGLVSFISASLGTFLSFQLIGCIRLYDDRKKETTLWRCIMVVWSTFVTISGTFLMISGTYGSVVRIIGS